MSDTHWQPVESPEPQSPFCTAQRFAAVVGTDSEGGWDVKGKHTCMYTRTTSKHAHTQTPAHAQASRMAVSLTWPVCDSDVDPAIVSEAGEAVVFGLVDAAAEGEPRAAGPKLLVIFFWGGWNVARAQG